MSDRNAERNPLKRNTLLLLLSAAVLLAIAAATLLLPGSATAPDELPPAQAVDAGDATRVAEGCELHIAEQQAECWCDRCQQYVHLVSQHVRRCPHCNNDQLQIVADDGLQIQRLELE